MSEKVAQPSGLYHEMAERWPLPRALMGGTPGMKAAGEEFLPKWEAESDKGWQIRMAGAYLMNAFGKTVETMTGRVFSKPIALGEDVPPKLVEYAENIDLAGRHINVFARQVFADALQTGISHILVDMPAALPEGSTLADEQSQGRRPYCVHVTAENLIGWKSELVNGKETLTQVRILESVLIPDGEFHEKKVEQVRVLEPGKWRLFRKVEDKWELFEEGTASLNKITLATFYAKRNGYMMARPPLEDLAHLNAAHWRATSDRELTVHKQAAPLLFAKCIDQDNPGQVTVGPSHMIFSTDPNAELSYVSPDAAGSAIGRDHLKDLEERMDVFGATLMVPKTGGITATASAIDHAETLSPLQAMALGLQDALEQALGFMAEYDGMGEDAGGSVEVNTDYIVGLSDGSDFKDLIALRNQGDLTAATLLKEGQRRQIISASVDVEDELEAAKDDVPLGLMAQMEPKDDEEKEAA